MRTRGLPVGIKLFQNFLPRLLDIHFKALQHTAGNAVTFKQQAKQDMLSADVRVVERFGFLVRKRQDFLDARSVGNVAQHLLIRPRANLLFYLKADGFQVEAEFLKDIHRNALTQLDDPEQQMFGAHEVVVEAVGFLARECQYLLGARREVAQGVTRSFRSARGGRAERFPQ